MKSTQEIHDLLQLVPCDDEAHVRLAFIAEHMNEKIAELESRLARLENALRDIAAFLVIN